METEPRENKRPKSVFPFLAMRHVLWIAFALHTIGWDLVLFKYEIESRIGHRGLRRRSLLSRTIVPGYHRTALMVRG